MSTGSLVSVFSSAVLPVLGIVAVGYVFGRLRPVDVEPINALAMYVLLPALVFDSLLSNPLGDAAVGLVTAILAFMVAMYALSEVVGRGLGASGGSLSALVLAGTFPNVGNFGIPVASFAFGDVGRTTAVVFVVVQTVSMYTLGVYVASRGEDVPRLAVFRRIAALPIFHAVVVALVLQWTGFVPPPGGTFMGTVGLVGDASIPLFLLVLGVQLANAEPGGTLSATLAPATLKLLVAPLVAIAVVLAVGVESPAVARSFVLLCAGPVAVTPLVILIEFGGPVGARDLSAITVVTLLGSVPVVTVLIALLRAGVLV